MRSNYFTRKMFLRQLAPALLAAVTLAFADMADAVVVGQRMGATGLAAVGLCIPIFMVINVIMHGFGIGGSVRYATLLADNQTEEASRLFQGVMVVALSSGAVCGIGCYLGLEQLLAILGTVPEDGELYVATYQYASIVCLCTPVFYLTYILQYFLQNDDKEAVAGWGFSIGMTVDIILNVVLVLMCDWGIRGAAVATVVGNLVTSSIFLLTISRKRSPLYPTTFSPDYRSGYQSFLAGVSSSSRYLFTMTFLIIANRCLLVMAGELGVAVLDILQNASFVVYYIYEAMARSAQPLLSTYHGEKNKEQLAVTRRIASLSGHCVAMITMGGICLLPAFICNLFGITRPEEVLLSTSALRLFCLGGLFGGANLLALSFAQSCHDEDTAFFITAMRGGVILLPVTLACAFLDVYYFWYLFPITELTTLLLTRLRATLRKKHTPPPPTVFAHTIGNDL
ncbi:MAG: MATE family efflux transporter, partial [Eubacteriales bacterium]